MGWLAFWAADYRESLSLCINIIKDLYYAVIAEKLLAEIFKSNIIVKIDCDKL